jgi:hypothetical protein
MTKRRVVKNVDGRVIGEVVGREFRKRVRGSIHFLHEPEGIASDVKALYDAKRLGADRVKVTDAETGIIYTSPIALIFAKGVRLDRGHGEQIVLPRRWWAEDNPNQPGLLP